MLSGAPEQLEHEVREAGLVAQEDDLRVEPLRDEFLLLDLLDERELRLQVQALVAALPVCGVVVLEDVPTLVVDDVVLHDVPLELPPVLDDALL